MVVGEAGEGTDMVRTAFEAYALVANVESLTFTGAGNFTGTGNDLDNTITGGAGNDTLERRGWQRHADRRRRQRHR